MALRSARESGRSSRRWVSRPEATTSHTDAGTPDAAPVRSDGPHPETGDLVAGWYAIDVDSYERAVELAAYVSSEPGPGGTPLYEWIQIRQIMEAPGTDSE